MGTFIPNIIDDDANNDDDTRRPKHDCIKAHWLINHMSQKATN